MGSFDRRGSLRSANDSEEVGWGGGVGSGTVYWERMEADLREADQGRGNWETR